MTIKKTMQLNMEMTMEIKDMAIKVEMTMKMDMTMNMAVTMKMKEIRQWE